MHARRAWAKAYVAMKQELVGLTDDEFKENPVVKGFLLCNEIFKADTPLKELEAEERLERRDKEVKPHVEAFFEFVHSFDDEETILEGKLGEAVTYAKNQEEHLRTFLENGNIPIDNGKSERCFKNIALGRKNSLFSYSMSGAESNAILYSIVETAKANGADVYTYVKYLLEEIPPKLAGKDMRFRDDIMPWSRKYLEYEAYQRSHHVDEAVPESNAPPEGLSFRIKGMAGKFNKPA